MAKRWVDLNPENHSAIDELTARFLNEAIGENRSVHQWAEKMGMAKKVWDIADLLPFCRED